MDSPLSPLLFDGIAVYEKAIIEPLEKIKAIEEIADNSTNPHHTWNRAAVVANDGRSEIADSRTNMLIHLGGRTAAMREDETLNSMNIEFHLIFSRCVSDYSQKFCFDINTEKSTNYTVLKYENNQHYVHHLDHGEKTPRIVSAVGYLNDDYLGGELDFDKLNFTYRPSSGDVVVFLSDEPYSHASLPVTSGVKYSVVNWW
jgi:hypothetical protein